MSAGPDTSDLALQMRDLTAELADEHERLMRELDQEEDLERKREDLLKRGDDAL